MVNVSCGEKMKIRKIAHSDRDMVLTSFKPMFGDWDYLPLVIDSWLEPSASQETWLAFSGPSETELIAMVQAYELETGDWYLRGLRSNPDAGPHQVACAILGLTRAARDEFKSRKVDTLRYGTLATFKESLRLAGLLGFREQFRLAHAHHQLPEVPDAVDGVKVEVPDDITVLYDYLRYSTVVKPTGGYFFTWWDTSKLRMRHLAQAQKEGLLFRAVQDGRMTGAGLFWHIPWQNFLVLSVIDGADNALKALFGTAINLAHGLGCHAIGMVHPSLEEMQRRQGLFGLGTHGDYTVQLIYTVK